MFCILFTCFYGVRKISAENVTTKSEEYQGVLSLWQIDSFEGGIGSRKQFLLKIARGFEKKHKGVLVMVTNITKDGAEENFKNGIYPDMISYGNGVDVKNFSEIKTEKTVKGGMIGDKIYATAWCRGGYVLISKGDSCENIEIIDELIVSKSEFTQPLTALYTEDIEVNKAEILPPMDAYVKFVSSKCKYLLGTQRDVNRLETRGMEVVTRPLKEYNDLYQYISITANEPVKKYYCEEYINYLLTESSQEELKKIGMMSCFYKIKHDNAHLQGIQNTESAYTISAFTSLLNLKEMQDLVMLAKGGNTQAKIKIKNMLI